MNHVIHAPLSTRDPTSHVRLLGREHQSSAVSPKYTMLPKSSLVFGLVELSGKAAPTAVSEQALTATL